MSGIRMTCAVTCVAAALMGGLGAQAPTKYEATIESLDKHPLPDWYAGAKLGIFIHWGLYSVPGWAPLNHPDHDFSSNDYIKYDPYAEWYLNTVRVPGSPTEKYDREHFGPHHDYYQFAESSTRRARSGVRRSGRRCFMRRARSMWC